MINDSALALANCLDAIERRELTLAEYVARHPDQHTVLTELAPLAQRLRAAPGVRPSPDFRVEARRHLIAQLSPRRTRRSGFGLWPQRPVLVRALAVLVILIVLGSSVVAASAQSLPTEVLYPVKIAIERVRLALSPDQLTRSELSLGFADERLSEMQQLIDRGQGGETAGVLDAFAEQIQSASENAHGAPASGEREALLARLRQSIDRSDEVLINSEARLPASAQPAIQRARAALRAVPPRRIPETPLPTSTPTITPTPTSTVRPPAAPTHVPPVTATPQPGVLPTERPTFTPPTRPVTATIHSPTQWPTVWPTQWPTQWLTRWPTLIPTLRQTARPTLWPTLAATGHPTFAPPILPTRTPRPTIMPGPKPTWPPAATVPPPIFPTWPPAGSPPATMVWPTPRRR